MFTRPLWGQQICTEVFFINEAAAAFVCLVWFLNLFICAYACIRSHVLRSMHVGVRGQFWRVSSSTLRFLGFEIRSLGLGERAFNS